MLDNLRFYLSFLDDLLDCLKMLEDFGKGVFIIFVFLGFIDIIVEIVRNFSKRSCSKQSKLLILSRFSKLYIR